MMFAFLVVLFIILACILLFFALISPSFRRHPDLKLLNGLFVSHRGLHDIENDVPENSLLAYNKAIDCGFAIEIDIHLTADGEVVVFHDSDLKRVCFDDRNITDVTLEELKKLCLLKTNQKIPTLKECLDLIDGKTFLLIEFKVDKNNWKALCEKANEILSGYQGKYFVQSFFPQVLYWYRKNRKDILRGQLSSGYIGDKIYHKLCENLLFNFVSRPDFISYEYSFYNRPIRKLATKLGAFPVGWTFPSQEKLDEIRENFNTYIFENFIPKR